MLFSRKGLALFQAGDLPQSILALEAAVQQDRTNVMVLTWFHISFKIPKCKIIFFRLVIYFILFPWEGNQKGKFYELWMVFIWSPHPLTISCYFFLFFRFLILSHLIHFYLYFYIILGVDEAGRGTGGERQGRSGDPGAGGGRQTRPQQQRGILLSKF